MTKKTLSFEQEFVKQPSFFTLPDGSPANRPGDVGTPYITNPFPTVDIEKATINKSSPITVEVDLSAIENVAGNPDPKKSWFSNTEFVNGLRVRVLACFDNAQTKDLDFLTQRMNEYQAGLMDIKGPANSNMFLSKMINQDDQNIFPILSSNGPLDVNSLTETIKKSNTQNKVLAMNGGEIYVFDAPIGTLFIMGEDGIPKFDLINSGPIVKAETSKKASLPKYKIRKTLLQSVTMTLSTSITDIEQVSFYAFVYNDKFELLNKIGANIKPADTQVTDVLENGLGFISDYNLLGEKTHFKKQVIGSSPTSMEVEKTNVAPQNEKLSQQESYEETNTKSNPAKFIRSSINNDINSTPSLKVSGQLIKTDGYFSSLWITKADADNARFGFVFDKKRFLMDNMLFPWLVMSDESSQEILDLCSPLDTQMKKRRVHYKGYAANSVGTNSRSIPYELSCYDPEEIVGPLSTERIYTFSENDSASIFYQGYDTYEELKKSQTLIKNQYGVNLCYRDPSLDYVKKSILELRAVENGLKRVVEVVRFQPTVIPLNNIKFYGSTVGAESNRLIAAYVKYYYLFSQKDTDQDGNAPTPTKSTMIKSLFNNLNKKGLVGFNDLINKVQRLVDSLETIVKAYLPNDSYNAGDPAVGYNIAQKGPAPTKGNILKVHHYFSEFFEFGRQCNTGYNYVINNEEEGGFSRQTTGFTKIKRQVYMERISTEFNKYFGSYETPESPGTNANAFAEGYSDSTYSYLTPKTIQVHGENPISQIGSRDSKSNEIVFDIDKYAKLFSDLVKVRRNTKYLNRPFYMSDKNMSLKEDLVESLLLHECSVQMGIDEQFSKLTIEKQKKPSIPFEVSEVKNIKKVSFNRDLMPLIYGGEGDESSITQNFLTDVITKIKPTILTQPSFFDLTAVIENKKSDDPVKLLFALLGELEVNSSNDGKDYESLQYNSMVNSAIKNLNLTSLNVKPKIEGSLSYLPNQLKSMFVVATSVEPESCDEQPDAGLNVNLDNVKLLPQDLDLTFDIPDQQLTSGQFDGACPEGKLGDGFDAMRFSLGDIDVGLPDQLISFVPGGIKKLPYQQTKDPMKVFSKFLTFWMNYKQICVVEYLQGFESPETTGAPPALTRAANSTSLKKMPIWNSLNQDILDDNLGSTFLCRVRNISLSDLLSNSSQDNTGVAEMTDPMDLFDLPIYNEYFLLSGEQQSVQLADDLPPTGISNIGSVQNLTAPVATSVGGLQSTAQASSLQTATQTTSVSVGSLSTNIGTGGGGY